MLELLNPDMSPIGEFVDAGDVSAVAYLPLVLRNGGAAPVIVDGRALPVLESDGHERLWFSQPRATTVGIGVFHVQELLGISIGDVLDVGAIFSCNWLAGYTCSAFRERAAVCSGLAEPVDFVANDLHHYELSVYLRNRSSGQWFSAALDGAGKIGSATPIAEPTIAWWDNSWWGYSVNKVSTAPLPSWASVVAAGQAVPVMACVGVTGGSATQNVFRLNPRRALLSAEGRVVL